MKKHVMDPVELEQLIEVVEEIIDETDERCCKRCRERVEWLKPFQAKLDRAHELIIVTDEEPKQ